MKFQEAITKFRQLQVDFHEYACMRATILFKTGKKKNGILKKLR